MKLSDIKAGDILFYTERPYGPDSDAAVEIVERDGELYPKTLCVMWNSEFVETSDMEKDWGFPIKNGFKESDWHRIEGFDRQNMVKFMTKNFPKYEVSKFTALGRESIIQLLEADIVYHTAFAGIARDKLNNFLKNG